MGGLISAYAVMKYPHIFSGAACLSTHWIGILSANNLILNAFYRFWKKKYHSIAIAEVVYGHQKSIIRQFIYSTPSSNSTNNNKKKKVLIQIW
jgi:hypothetical protein